MARFYIIFAILLGFVTVADAQTDRQFVREGNKLFDKQ